MRARGLVVAALGCGLMLTACKHTVEGENKEWDRNVQHVAEVKALYPGFGAALDEQLKRAQDAMAAARNISDKEAAARSMAQANELLTQGFVYTLGQLDTRSKALRQKLVTASATAQDPSDQAAARAATEDAQRILKNVDDTLKTGAPDATAAAAVVRKIDGDLSSASANLERVLDGARKRKQAATAQAAGGPAGAAAAAAAPVKVTWKCTYCGHVNDDGAKKCSECGAPRPDPNAPPKGGAKVAKPPTPKKK
jgi:rubrerythrin